MVTLPRASDYLYIGELNHPGGALLADDSPAIHAVPAERDLQRSLWTELRNISCLHKIVLTAEPGWDQQIADRGQPEGGDNHGPDAVNGYGAETASGRRQTLLWL